MKNFKNYIQNLDKKILFLIYVLTMISLTIINSSMHKFENGYLFFLSFFFILLLYMLILVLLFRGIYFLERTPRFPFHLMKYSFYFLIFVFGSAPFVYLWAMRHVISHLKWQIHLFNLYRKTNRIYSVRFYFICIFVPSSRSL